MVDKEILGVVKQWFQKAGNDVKNIENNLKSDDCPTDTVCFHAQQAIEKYIKGTLIYFGQGITKTHDLVHLLSSLAPFMPELASLENELDDISHYGVEVRYPDSFYEPTIEEADKAYKLAEKVKTIVFNKIKI